MIKDKLYNIKVIYLNNRYIDRYENAQYVYLDRAVDIIDKNGDITLIPFTAIRKICFQEVKNKA